jgi:hypothetical protein
MYVPAQLLPVVASGLAQAFGTEHPSSAVGALLQVEPLLLGLRFKLRVFAVPACAVADDVADLHCLRPHTHGWAGWHGRSKERKAWKLGPYSSEGTSIHATQTTGSRKSRLLDQESIYIYMYGSWTRSLYICIIYIYIYICITPGRECIVGWWGRCVWNYL